MVFHHFGAESSILDALPRFCLSQGWLSGYCYSGMSWTPDLDQIEICQLEHESLTYAKSRCAFHGAGSGGMGAAPFKKIVCFFLKYSCPHSPGSCMMLKWSQNLTLPKFGFVISKLGSPSAPPLKLFFHDGAQDLERFMVVLKIWSTSNAVMRKTFCFKICKFRKMFPRECTISVACSRGKLFQAFII